jgi:primosomal replication protein N
MFTRDDNLSQIYYTESDFVNILETNKIAYPSTIDTIIDTLYEQKYVNNKRIEGCDVTNVDLEWNSTDGIKQCNATRIFGTNKQYIQITPLGISVVKYLVEHFNTFFTSQYVRDVDEQIDNIAFSNDVENATTALCKNYHSQIQGIVTTLNDGNINAKVDIDNNHSLIIGKHGPVIQYENAGNVFFIPTKQGIDVQEIAHQKANGKSVLLDDIVEPSTTCRHIGKYRGRDLFIRRGRYGVYAQWGDERKSLPGISNINVIEYLDIIKQLDMDTTLLDPKMPVNLVRVLNKHLSIRTGKFGDYIFYKRPRMKTPQFYKIPPNIKNYSTCPVSVLLEGIHQTYGIE